MYLFRLVFFFSLGKYLEVGLLDYMAILNFWGTSILFSIVMYLYIPANSAQGFPFLHILANTGYYFSFW